MKTILLSILLAVSLSAASITGIACAAGVATVTVANSLVASQGFEITGTSVSAYNINGTAVSANSTSFTFNTTCAGSATGGTFQPAIQVIVQAITPNNAGSVVSYILWTTTTTPVSCPACASNFANATPAQLAALQAGTTIETVGQFGIPVTETVAQLAASLQALYTSAQTPMANGLGKYTGYCYNGSAWSATCN